MTKCPTGLNLLSVPIPLFGHRGWAAYALAAAAILGLTLAFCGCRKPPENPVPRRLAPVSAEPSETARPAPDKKEDRVYVKVKREKDGRYTWELSGKDVNKIIQTDRRLRRSFRDGVETRKEE